MCGGSHARHERLMEARNGPSHPRRAAWKRRPVRPFPSATLKFPFEISRRSPPSIDLAGRFLAKNAKPGSVSHVRITPRGNKLRKRACNIPRRILFPNQLKSGTQMLIPGRFRGAERRGCFPDCESPGCKLHSTRPFPGLMYLGRIFKCGSVRYPL